MIYDKSLEEFQYGHHDGYFANKNVGVSANLIDGWLEGSHYFFQLN